MKKQYTKPGIIIEDFEISQNISVGGCGAEPGKTNHGSPSSCGLIVDGTTIVWVDSKSKCTSGWPADDTEASFGEYCYNNPDGKILIFGS